MRKLKALLAILSLLGIIIGCTEATTTEVITNDKKTEYKISFNANGGKGKMSDINIIAETSIILPENTFTRDNYTFMGWATTADGEVMFKNGAIFEGLYSDITLYAKWEKEATPVVKITITFDVNGVGGTAPTAIETTPDENVDLPVLTNAKFSHWNTKADGSGQSYKTTATFAESVTLYAILLAENAHTITYELDGGVNNTVNLFSFTEEDTVTLKNPTKNGYKFAGWYETADFSGSVVKGWFAGDKTANVILYAKWEKEVVPVVKITITFDVNGAGGTVPTAIETTPDENVELPVLTNAKFSHWNTSPDGSGQSYNGTATFTESVTLYAILLAENDHTITYELNGGVNHSKSPYSFTEDDAVILREPTRDGYKFVGWYESPDFSDSIVKGWFAGDKTENVTLYAMWLKDGNGKYTVGTGVYEIKANKYDLPYNSSYTRFKVLLLKNNQLNSNIELTEGSLKDPLAQLTCGYDLNFPNYDAAIGNATVKSGTENLNCAWVTLDENYFTFCVDMSKILIEDTKEEIKVFGDITGMGNSWLKSGRDLDLTDYKPYVVGLFHGESDIVYNGITYKYIGQCWAGSVWEMKTSTATKPTSFDDFLPEADVYTIDLTTTKQPGAKFRIEGAAFAGANAKDITFTDGVATLVFNVTEGELNGWGKKHFACWFKFYAGDDTTLAKTSKQYYAGKTTLGKAINIADNSSIGVDLEVEDLTNTEAGTYMLTVDARGDIPTIKVDKIEISSINIKSYPKIISYYTGDSFDMTGLTIEAILSNGETSNIVITSDMIKGFDSSVVGTQTLTVTYCDCTATFEVEIKEIKVVTIEVTANNVVDTILGLTDTGYYLLKLSGEITSETIEKTSYAIRNSDARIALDLSATTGLTVIDDEVFQDCRNLTSVIIPDSVTSIGDWAFKYCDSLTSVVIPDSVTSIGYNAFYGCDSLTYNKYDNGLYLGNNDNPYLALIETSDTSITSYEINNETKIIASNAFDGCSSLTSVIIPDSVTSIGDYVFNSCYNLTSVTIGTGLTEISRYAFNNCSNLVSVIIPDNITSIGEFAFSICSCLTSIVISDSVTSIGGDAFYGCESLISFNVNANNENYSSSDDGKILLNKDKTKIISYPSATGNVTISSSITTIGDRAFYGCDSLTSVIIPDSVTSIGDGAFCGCESLISVTIPDSVTSINHEAFASCSSLESITIPDSVTSIDKGAFAGCSNLESVTIPDRVTTIVGWAFFGCNNLTIVNYKGTQEQWGQISIGSENGYLISATINYNYSGE